MQSLLQAYNKVIEQKLYSQNPAPTQLSLEQFEALLLKEKFTAYTYKPLNDLMAVGLELGLIPYLKRYGINVDNKNFKNGDLIGLYFARIVKLDKNNSLIIRGKFCGLDLSESTINLQYFAPDDKVDDQILKLAKTYNVEEQITRGSLRISLDNEQLSKIVEDFISLAKS